MKWAIVRVVHTAWPVFANHYADIPNPMTAIIDQLVAKTEFSEQQLRTILEAHPGAYRTFKARKADGGLRVICEPSVELKMLQRTLEREVANVFPIDDAAYAYRAGRSIKANAEVHANAGAIRYFDFADFFSSLTSSDWHACCGARVPHWSGDDLDVSTRVFFNDTLERGVWRLAMGAPSSPFISNVLLAAFDEEVRFRVMPFGITYTRYADDLTFSATSLDALDVVDDVIAKALQNSGYQRLALNPAKTGASAVPSLGAVTGVYIDGSGGLSAGEGRKRAILDQMRKALAGNLPPTQMASLKGSLAFALEIEPEFRVVLDEAFGVAEVEWVRRYAPPGGWPWEQRAHG